MTMAALALRSIKAEHLVKGTINPSKKQQQNNTTKQLNQKPLKQEWQIAF